METFQPRYFYSAKGRIERQWCATWEELARLFLFDARWRDTPSRNDDVIAFLHDQGLRSEGEHLLAWTAAWCDLANAQAVRDKLTKGPFAHYPVWEKFRRIVPNESVMVALKPLDYDGWIHVVHEVFKVKSRLDVKALIASGKASLASEALFKDDQILYRHQPTARFFLKLEQRDVYKALYEAYIYAGGVPSDPYIPPQEPATVPLAQFEPDGTLYKYWGRSSRFSGLSLVYALEPVCADGYERHEGEIFPGGTFDVEKLLQQGKVKSVPQGAQFAMHVPTKRFFLGDGARDAYAKRYELHEPRNPPTTVQQALPSLDTAGIEELLRQSQAQHLETQRVIDSAQQSLAESQEARRRYDEWGKAFDRQLAETSARFEAEHQAFMQRMAQRRPAFPDVLHSTGLVGQGDRPLSDMVLTSASEEAQQADTPRHNEETTHPVEPSQSCMGDSPSEPEYIGPGRRPDKTKGEYDQAYVELFVANGKKHPSHAQLAKRLGVAKNTIRGKKGYRKRYGIPDTVDALKKP